MLFHSQLFILVFLPLIFTTYYVLSNYKTVREWLIIIASCSFYAYANTTLLPVLVCSIVFNYAIAFLYSQSTKRNFLMILGIVFNLFLLGYFKYTNFALDNLTTLFGQDYKPLDIALPIGISFFTFQQISYLFDLKKGNAILYPFRQYAFYISFFPQLIAGPIVRHNELIPQLGKTISVADKYKNWFHGLSFFIAGLTKKLIADELAPMSDAVFNHTMKFGAPLLDAWAGLVAFSMQIYLDFSAYSDMAVGIALLFGFTLPYNFNSPYKATSIREFWHRWHITLSSFLRDYVYIQMGGNRNGQVRQFLGLTVTFLLCGLWHGAGWTFVIWGGIHGLALIINHLWKKVGLSLPSLLGWLITFSFVTILWVLFRAENMTAVLNLAGSLISNEQLVTVKSIPKFSINSVLLVVSIIIVLLFPNTQTIINHQRYKPWVWLSFIMALMLVLEIWYFGHNTETFIYFAF